MNAQDGTQGKLTLSKFCLVYRRQKTVGRCLVTEHRTVGRCPVFRLERSQFPPPPSFQAVVPLFLVQVQDNPQFSTIYGPFLKSTKPPCNSQLWVMSRALSPQVLVIEQDFPLKFAGFFPREKSGKTRGKSGISMGKSGKNTRISPLYSAPKRHSSLFLHPTMSPVVFM